MPKKPMHPKVDEPPKVPVFGGRWSLSKLDIVESYFKFFNTALKGKPFKRVYIDGFAGSGAFRYLVGVPKNTLFGPRDESEDVHAGSARRALNAKPSFDEIILIEEKKPLAESLQALIVESGHPKARVERGDANEVLRKICRPSYWKDRRGIIFLDPFGMNVDWSTLEMIAATQALDLWFLFSLAGLVRNLPRRASGLDTGKRAAITRVLGTEEWFDEFYKIPTLPPHTLWGTASTPLPPSAARRTASVKDIEAYVLKRLETIFPHVEQPRRLTTRKNLSLFSLFFAVSNPSEAAIKLAQKGAAHILKTRA
jgi:three-Cys-motif partner protein